MECSQIKRLLSEYVDSTLDNNTLNIIEGHLKTCGECKGEYTSLKALVNELGSIETLKAPEDFLEKVHDRIESRSFLNHMRGILFFPSRIKVTRELAALTTTALVVVVILYMFAPDKQVILETPITKKSEMTIKTERIEGGITDKNAPLIQSWKEGVPIELILLLDTEDVTTLPSSKNVLLVTTNNGTGMDDGSIFQSKADRSQKIDLVDALISDIYEMISLEEGRLLLEENSNETDTPEYITLEIPGINYHSFLERINKIGTFQTPAPNLSKEYKDPVLLQIQLISSN
jgi:hypothetical protein